MELIRASAEMFALVQNVSRLKEIWYLQALIYNHMALQAERCGKDSTAFCTSREEAAAMFLKRSSQLKRSAFVTIEPFFNLEAREKICQVITHWKSANRVQGEVGTHGKNREELRAVQAVYQRVKSEHDEAVKQLDEKKSEYADFEKQGVKLREELKYAK
ncbi:hypothetical protein PsorP6_011432 [Peronosclerospora sorghi]|uniref:Uncharacterized protein n=1 Tax=Peronosclerospora sorghi TaxID=230839 RepID=A0ACC0WJ47_9STRA|nr:hypothetical protein PsorP6_011432 [Peronosclerospora sorghi]